MTGNDTTGTPGDVEAFLYREADCLDRADLKSWMDLYSENGAYWMPASPTQSDPDTHISIFNDDRLLMDIRRRNFGHEFAASMEHDVRCSHLIGNIRIADPSSGNSGLRVTSNFQAVIFYRREQTLYAGRYTHDLVRNEAGYRIQYKRVDLINCDAPTLRSIVIYI